MDLSKFNKINRSESSFEFNDENTGYKAKGKRRKVWGGGLGLSFSMSSEIISESDPKGIFPLMGLSFDDILSLGSNENNEKAQKKFSKRNNKALKNTKTLPDNTKNKESKSVFEQMFDFWF